MNAISGEEWLGKIRSTKKGTSPGLSGESIDMLGSLDDDCSDLVRRVCNFALRSKRVFWQWKRRAKCRIPKVPGNPDVALSRPISLLSVTGKVFWSVLSDRITRVWREHGLLHKQQYGSTKGVNTTEPLIIATLAAEQCYDLKQPLIIISQDIPLFCVRSSRLVLTPAFALAVGVTIRFSDDHPVPPLPTTTQGCARAVYNSTIIIINGESFHQNIDLWIFSKFLNLNNFFLALASGQ